MSEQAQTIPSAVERCEQGRPRPRLVFLMNVIAPYHKPVLDELSRRYEHFRILLSTPMESNRSWRLEWEGLDVAVQKNFTLNRRWRHPKGFTEPLFVHVPIDTIGQLEAFKAEVVVSWEMGMRTILAAGYRRIRRRTKLMVWAEFAESTEHGRGRARHLLRKVLHHAIDAFIVTGNSGARYLSSLGIPEHKIHRIVYTTDVSKFAAMPLERPAGSARRLLYVGQLIERKGLMPFLEVLKGWCSQHPEENVAFTLAGDGPQRTELATGSLPNNLSLTLLGNIAYEALPEIYMQSDIFVFPTLADTWGVVVNEALAGGMPVLGSVYGQAVSELVRDGVNGWTFRPDVNSEVAGALNRALATAPEKLHAMRNDARQTALRLTPEYVAALVDQAISACAGKPRVT